MPPKRKKEVSKEKGKREGTAKPSTAPTPEDLSLSLSIKILFDAYSDERSRCYKEDGKTTLKVKMPLANTGEYQKFAEWVAVGTTEQDMRDRVRRFWDLRDKDGTYFWRDQGITVPPFCNHDEVGNAPTNQTTPFFSPKSPHNGTQTPLTSEDCQMYS